MPTMTGDEARERFAEARSVTLATADAAGRPHLVPVVFALTTGARDGQDFREGKHLRAGEDLRAGKDLLVFAVDHKPKRSHRLKRLANIRANPAVSLLADAYDEEWERLWWARADGTARVLPPADRSPLSARHADLLARRYGRHYGTEPPRGPVVEIAVTRWTGWRAS